MPEHIFTSRAETFDNLPWFNDKLLLEWASGLLSEEGTSIVDIGAGTGLAIPSLSRHFRRVRGIEPNEQMYLYGKQKITNLSCLYNSKKSEIEWNRMTFEELLNEPPQYDVLFFKNSLHHIGNSSAIIRSSLEFCSRAVAVLDVVGPCLAATEFARRVVLMKEPERSPDTFLTNTYASLCPEKYWISVYFDQFLVVEQWLENAGISEELSNDIIKTIQLAPPEVRDSLKIHRSPKGLKMLRRNELCIFRR